MRASGGAAERRGAGSPRAREAGAVGLIVAAWLVTAAVWLQPGLLLPDGAGYIVYLPSTVLDQDLLFFDEWAEMGMIDRGVILHKDITRTSHLGNHWTVGSALTWLPAFGVADLVRPMLGKFPRNGLSLPYNVAIVTTTAMAGLATLLLGFSIARTASGASASALAAIGAWLGTPLIWYALSHATMAHAISAMAAALVFAIAMAMRGRAETESVFLAGLAVGFAFAVRPQNAPLAFVPLIVATIPFRRWLAYAMAMLIGALPQLVVSYVLYGSPAGFLTGGDSAKPFAALERVWWWEPLFSWYHGLFTWTPFALIGIVGLFVLMRRDWRLATAGLFLFAAQWAINATLERSFWGATSFGQRRFDSCVVVIIIGAAALFEVLPMVIRAVGFLVPVAWTLSLFVAARAGAIDLARYYTPAELVSRVTEGFASIARVMTPLGSIPTQFRLTVAILMLVFAAVSLAVAIVVVAPGSRATGTLVATYFIAASLFLAWCGVRDSARVDEYRALIDRNRLLAQMPGGADVRFGLLGDEIDYLRKSGRTSEAEKVERELATLRQQRAEAMKAAGLQ